MVFFLLRLREKVLRQLRKRIRREMRRDRDVLQGSAKLISNLLIDGIDYFIADQHMNLSVKTSPLRHDRAALKRLPARFSSDPRKAKSPAELIHRAFCSGDVLLSHNLSSHYHRGCSVSLPCSEWERVGPLRYDHQRKAANLSPFSSGELQIFRLSMAVFQSSILNLHSAISTDSLRSTYRKCYAFKASFSLII